jgi:hypothetical protein
VNKSIIIWAIYRGLFLVGIRDISLDSVLARSVEHFRLLSNEISFASGKMAGP